MADGVTASVRPATPADMAAVAALYGREVTGGTASFELEPNNADVAELRLRLMRADKPVSETWLYRWTAS